MIRLLYETNLDTPIGELCLLADDKNLMEDLGADSLDTVQIVMELEEAFNVEITDDEAETLTTVGAIKKYIEENT